MCNLLELRTKELKRHVSALPLLQHRNLDIHSWHVCFHAASSFIPRLLLHQLYCYPTTSDVTPFVLLLHYWWCWTIFTITPLLMLFCHLCCCPTTVTPLQPMHYCLHCSHKSCCDISPPITLSNAISWRINLPFSVQKFQEIPEIPSRNWHRPHECLQFRLWFINGLSCWALHKCLLLFTNVYIFTIVY